MEKKIENMLSTLEMLSYAVATHQELLSALAKDAEQAMKDRKKERSEMVDI